MAIMIQNQASSRMPMGMRMPASAKKVEPFLQALAKLSEKELTVQVLEPLFSALGYSRVEYSHGAREQGRDMICFGTDELGDLKITVVQVKLYRPSRKAADPKSFSEIVTQLSQAAETPIETQEYGLQKPNCVYFITPFPVDVMTLQTRFHAYDALRIKGLRVLDGLKLAALAEKHVPHLMGKLAGIAGIAPQLLKEHLTNATLMAALQGSSRRVKDIYTDVDFWIGGRRSRLLLSSSLQPRDLSFNLDRMGLERLAVAARAAGSKSSFLTPSIEEIKRELKPKEDAFNAWLERAREAERGIKQAEESLVAEKDAFMCAFCSRDELHSSREACVTAPSGLDEANVMEAIQGEKRPAVLAELAWRAADFSSTGDVDYGELVSVLKEHPLCRSKEDALSALDRGQIVRQKKAECMGVREALESERPDRPKASVILHGGEIGKFIDSRRRWIDECVSRINRREMAAAELTRFVADCSELVVALQAFFESEVIVEALGFTSEQDAGMPGQEEWWRITAPIHEFLDAGKNLVVLGEAGAGKTTSLQMYAQRRVAASDALVLFVPLSRLAQNWGEEEGPATKKVSSSVPSLEEVLCAYINAAFPEFSLTPRALADEFESRDALLLLDGVDEAIKLAPWLPASIADFSRRYRKTQLVVSSRLSGEYMETLPFAGVTLLPFTDRQRDEFFSRWFANHKDREAIETIGAHLKKRPEMSEVVRSPLLATVLCVLRERGVPLPDTEVRLYHERMNLLLGVYDIAKGVSRIRGDRSDLWRLCRKLAFDLQRRGRRECTREEVCSLGRAVFRHYRIEAVSNLVAELIDPCNVLVSMTPGGAVGFGHRRFQEYLVACEINENRAIDLGQLIKGDASWWGGALELWAQMADSIEWFVDEYLVRRACIIPEGTLDRLLSARPRPEQERIRAKIDSLGSHDP